MKIPRFAVVLHLLVPLLLGLQAHAATVALADGALTANAKIYQDDSGSLSFQEVVTPEISRQFSPMNALSTNFGFSRSAYWVAIELENNGDAEQAFVLRQDYPLIDYVDVWEQLSDGQWQLHATGDRRAFQQRDVNHRDFLFPLSIKAHTQSTIYVRFVSDGPINISLSLFTPTETMAQISLEQLLFGGYFGGFLVLIIYNLIIFLVVRDKAYLYYMLYVLSLGVYMGVHNGLAYQFLWPDNPWFANQGLLFFLGLSVIFGLHFSRIMCNIGHYAPRFNRFTYLLLVVSVVLLLASPFLSYKALILPYSFNTLLVSASMLTLGFISLFRGSKAARYFVVAWAAFLIGVILYMLKTFGVIPHTTFTQNAFQIGSLIEMVLLSLALSARVSEIKEIGNSDPLTSLANRRVLDGVLPLEFENAQKGAAVLSLLVLDIDHFKRFNDTLGHAVGDEVIERVGYLLREQVRKPHLPCRYGGEEFVVVLPGVDAPEAMALAERLRCQIENHSAYALAITVSIGVSTFTGTEFENHQAMFDAADVALYQAKKNGRNQVRLAEQNQVGVTLT